MTYILEIGDRRRLKAGIRVLHHTGNRAPCSGGRLNFAEARHATSAHPSPSEERHPRTRKRRRRSTRAASIAGRAKRAGTPASTAHTPVIRRPAALAMPTEAGQAAPLGSRWTHPRTAGQDRAAAVRWEDGCLEMPRMGTLRTVEEIFGVTPMLR